MSRAWALSLAWGWIVLLTAGALAVALDLVDLRDALDVPRSAGARAELRPPGR